MRYAVSLLMLAVSTPALAADPASDAELRATIARQQAQIDALTARLNALEAKEPAVATAAPQPTKPKEEVVLTRFRGSPEFSTESGWRFKVRGRINYDTSYVDNPDDALTARDLGLKTRFRRARIGVEGDMPGGFGYKAEFDFADASVRAADVVLNYRASKQAPFELAIGHFEPLNGFEQISSSRYISTLERGGYNEAFGNSRRLGAALTYIAPEFRVSAGVFNDTVNADKQNDEVVLAARAFWAPKWGETQLHLGSSIAYRTYQSNQLGFTYRARPFTNGTDTRFVDTGTLALRSDLIVGGEFIAIRGPFHFIAEAQRLSANTIRSGETLAPGDVAQGRRTSFDPAFFGGYAEVGYFFTGETRGYQNGLWARTRPLNPLGDGGIGAVSLNLRYDHLDLSDRARAATTAAGIVDGGRQDGYLAALVWQPTDYVRFTFQYAHGVVTGGPLQPVVNPLSAKPVGDRSFQFDMGALRAAWDF